MENTYGRRVYLKFSISSSHYDTVLAVFGVPVVGNFDPCQLLDLHTGQKLINIDTSQTSLAQLLNL